MPWTGREERVAAVPGRAPDRLDSAGIILQLFKHAKNVKSNELHFPTSKSLKNSAESSSQVGGFYRHWDFEPLL